MLLFKWFFNTFKKNLNLNIFMYWMNTVECALIAESEWKFYVYNFFCVGSMRALFVTVYDKICLLIKEKSEKLLILPNSIVYNPAWKYFFVIFSNRYARITLQLNINLKSFYLRNLSGIFLVLPNYSVFARMENFFH